jgi:hypothetical protein
VREGTGSWPEPLAGAENWMRGRKGDHSSEQLGRSNMDRRNTEHRRLGGGEEDGLRG